MPRFRARAVLLDGRPQLKSPGLDHCQLDAAALFRIGVHLRLSRKGPLRVSAVFGQHKSPGGKLTACMQGGLRTERADKLLRALTGPKERAIPLLGSIATQEGGRDIKENGRQARDVLPLRIFGRPCG